MTENSRSILMTTFTLDCEIAADGIYQNISREAIIASAQHSRFHVIIFPCTYSELLRLLLRPFSMRIIPQLGRPLSCTI